MEEYTTIKQSKWLLKIGIDKSTADLWRSYVGMAVVGKELVPELSSDRSHINPFKIREDDIPCWSLGALLKIMPSHIGRNKWTDEDGNLLGYASDNKEGGDVGWFYLHNDGRDWVASYGLSGDYVCLNPDSETPPYLNAVAYGSTPIEAVYEMVVWLIDNGFIKVEKKEE